MKFVIVLALFVACIWAKGSYPMPFPKQFTATYNESNPATNYSPPQMRRIVYDLMNERIRISILGYISIPNQDWFLINSPPGAEAGSPASRGYTLVAVNAEGVNAPNNCYYQVTGDMSAAPFPGAWYTGEGWQKSVGVWPFEYPTDLGYSGTYYVDELGVTADRWDSAEICNLVLSGIGKVPCTSIMLSRDNNRYPLMTIRAIGRNPQGSQDDSYEVRVFHSFVPTVKDSDFALPNNWPVTCGYGDTGFTITPYPVVIANAPNQHVGLSLRAPPVRGLGGKTKVYLPLMPNDNYKCTHCVELAEQFVVFDETNWNRTAIIPASYVTDGCTRFRVIAVGGGYDWQLIPYTDPILVTTCEGDPVTQQCSNGSRCGQFS